MLFSINKFTYILAFLGLELSLCKFLFLIEVSLIGQGYGGGYSSLIKIFLIPLQISKDFLPVVVFTLEDVGFSLLFTFSTEIVIFEASSIGQQKCVQVAIISMSFIFFHFSMIEGSITEDIMTISISNTILKLSYKDTATLKI